MCVSGRGGADLTPRATHGSAQHGGSMHGRTVSCIPDRKHIACASSSGSQYPWMQANPGIRRYALTSRCARPAKARRI